MLRDTQDERFLYACLEKSGMTSSFTLTHPLPSRERSNRGIPLPRREGARGGGKERTLVGDIPSRYPAGIEAIRDPGTVYVERYEEEIVADDRMNLRIRLRFANGWLLEEVGRLIQ